MRHRYLVVYAPTATGFGAHVPDLPGLVAAGSTLGETRELMREAMKAHLEDMRASGEDIPEADPGEVAEYLEVEISDTAPVQTRP